MILTGPEILKQVKARRIQITPFNRRRINPASYDLALGSKVAVYKDAVHTWGPGGYSTGRDGAHFQVANRLVLDAKKKLSVLTFDMDPEQGWVLLPGILYLMHTAEVITSDSFNPVLDGKSSIGRLGIVIHLTAGYGDIGYLGQYTLEVTAVHPVKIYPGMRFCQMRFHAVEGETLSYKKTGNYKGKAATGPVPSKAWKSAFK
jgi:dCTP deaminase